MWISAGSPAGKKGIQSPKCSYSTDRHKDHAKCKPLKETAKD